MRLQITVIIFMLALGYNDLSAQSSKPADKWKFSWINQVGLLQGEKGGAFHGQTIPGVEKHGWFAGAGVGIDEYAVRTVPLFASVRKYFGQNYGGFFVYTDNGIGFAWPKSDETAMNGMHYEKGFYNNTGIGWRLGIGKNRSQYFVLSMGYSYKRVEQKSESQLCLSDGSCHLYSNRYLYNLNRLIMQLGLIF